MSVQKGFTKDRAVVFNPLRWIVPLAVVAALVPSQSASQTVLRSTIAAGVPLTDENLNGIEDAEEELTDEQSDPGPTETQAAPVFESTLQDVEDAEVEALAGSPQLRRDSNDLTRGDDTGDGTLTFDEREASQLENNARERPAQRVDVLESNGTLRPLANQPAQPLQGGNLQAIDDPYAPLGIRVGTFTLFPSLTQTLGYTSNADFSTNGRESAFSQTEARIQYQSDWSLHQLRGSVGGSYQSFFNGVSEDLPTFDADTELRLDRSNGFTTTFGGNLRVATESATSDNLTVPVGVSIIERPLVYSAGAFAEIARTGGRLNGSLRGALERNHYESAALSDGSSLSQDDRNNTLFLATARLSYESSPALQPFVEASLGTRVYDEEIDRNGNMRDSIIYGLRGGVEFNRGEKLSGEIAIGYRAETFDDPAIATLDGLTLDANVAWSPQRFTTVSAALSTRFDGSTNLDENGSLTYAGSLGISRQIKPNLTVDARALGSLQVFDSSGREDRTLQLDAGAEWRLNPNLALVGRLGYETVDSTEPGSTYDAFTARFGVRVQR